MVAIRNILLLFLCITVFTPILLYTYTDRLTAFNYSFGVFLIVCLLNSNFLLLHTNLNSLFIFTFFYMHSAAEQEFVHNVTTFVSNSI